MRMNEAHERLVLVGRRTPPVWYSISFCQCVNKFSMGGGERLTSRGTTLVGT